MDSNFYPRPPRGGRLGSIIPRNAPAVFLSTPSARRATFFRGRCVQSKIFLSTPSARRATGDDHILGFHHDDFYPRPPRGGRRLFAPVRYTIMSISIHALREEGDVLGFALLLFPNPFLSTPSARRATAKTETKSLFSNKLYNILHEFRRALIYNGSKNYPNHAK